MYVLTLHNASHKYYIHTINCLEGETLMLVDSFCNTARKTIKSQILCTEQFTSNVVHIYITTHLHN